MVKEIWMEDLFSEKGTVPIVFLAIQRIILERLGFYHVHIHVCSVVCDTTSAYAVLEAVFLRLFFIARDKSNCSVWPLSYDIVTFTNISI